MFYKFCSHIALLDSNIDEQSGGVWILNEGRDDKS